mmetsp:Transcript_15718/g.59782  ORF Transcript_15718/g.59782 Transcript_15718/m.59782 type:complete len:222 (+) Transcript_15718:227-892(+)
MSYVSMEPREDPYYVVRNDASTNIDLVRLKHQDFMQQLETGNLATDRQLKGLRRVIMRDARKCQQQLKDLELSIQMVTNNRGGFDHIDDRELAQRREFIQQNRAMLTAIQEDVDGEKYKVRVAADEARAVEELRSQDTYGAKTEVEMGNSNYINQQQALTKLRMREQGGGIHLANDLPRMCTTHSPMFCPSAVCHVSPPSRRDACGARARGRSRRTHGRKH